MSYGLKYEAQVAGLDGREWRARLSLRDYTGTVSTVTPAADFIELFWGDRSDDQITTTHLPGRLILRISDKSGSLWQEFVDADNKTWQVRVQNRSIGDSIWVDSFFGLYVPDTFTDDETDKPNVVRIEFRDGLTLLEDEPFVDPETAEEDLGEVTVVEALHKVFSSLPYQRQFNVLHSLFPYKKNGGQFDGTVDPFSLLTFKEAGLLDDQELVRSGALSKKDVLLELCKAFGCTVVQSRGIWWIRQHAHLAKENGTGLRIWRYRGDTGALLSSGTTSIVHDLSEMESRRGRPRFHEQRFTQADVSFEASTNTALSDKLFLEETWENDSGTWLTEDRWVFEEVVSSGTSVGRATWDLMENNGVVDIRSATGDVQGLWLDTTDEFISPYARTSGIGTITRQTGDALLKVSFDISHSKSRNTVRFRAEIGHYYLNVTPVEVRGRYRSGDVELRVEPLPGSGTVLYEGQAIPMTVVGTNPSNGDGVATLTVSEDAKGGDRRVRGRLSADLMDLSFTEGNFPRLWVYHWAPTEDVSASARWLNGLRHLPADFESKRLSGVDLLVPTTTLQGEKVTGDLTCYWGANKRSGQSGNASIAVGDVSIGLEPKEGSNLVFTRRASAGMEGESVAVESIFGDRLSSNARRGFFMPDQPVVDDWRIDPYPGFLPNGDALTDLQARAIVAASTGAKRTAELLPRKGQDIVLPHEVLEWRAIFSHARQTLTELVYLPFQGAYEATMQALSWDQQLFDAATLTTPEEAEEGAGSSRNFVVSSAINLSGSGASSWGELSGKPSGLLARNGDSDGFNETTGLTSNDILTPINAKVTDWDNAFSWGNHSTEGYLKEQDISRNNWDTAFSWGDHSTEGYLKEIDIDRSDWDEAFSWGDHAAAGYLEKAVGGTVEDILRVENDNFLPEGLLQVTRTSGSHASKLAIYLSSSTGFETGASPDATAQLRNENAGFTFSSGNESTGTILLHLEENGDANIPTGDLYVAGVVTAGGLDVTGYNNANWDEAFSWGDHALEGYLKETDISRTQWDEAYNRSVTGVSGNGNGTLTINQQVGDVTADLSHTHATLSTGTGLNGGNYNGGSGQTWSLNTTFTDNRYANLSGDTFTGDIEIGSSLRANASAARFEVDSGSQTSLVMGFLEGLPKNQEEDEFWGSGDRGFWVREGDNLVIDGDVEYENGNWLIENDASLKIVDGITGEDIIKLGTDSGDKGLFLYTGADPNTKLVSLTQNGLTAEDFRLEAGGDFWDSDGSFRFGGTSGITKGTSGGITLGSNTTIEGTLSGADGTFSGSLQAATGSFAGDISAATGTFSGDLSAAGGTFSGDLEAVGGTFSGSLSAASGTFTGSLEAATGDFAGDLTAAGGTFAGDLQAVGGTFSGSLQAASGSFSGDLDAVGGTFSGSLQAAGGTFSGDLSAAGGTFSGDLSAAGGSFSGDLSAAGGTFEGTVTAGAVQSTNYSSGTGDFAAAGTKFDLSTGTIEAERFFLTQSGNIDARGGTVGGWGMDGVKLFSEGGAVQLHRSRGVQIKADADTELGSISWWEEVSGNQITKSFIQGSGDDLRLRSADGDVRISARNVIVQNTEQPEDTSDEVEGNIRFINLQVLMPNLPTDSSTTEDWGLYRPGTSSNEIRIKLPASEQDAVADLKIASISGLEVSYDAGDSYHPGGETIEFRFQPTSSASFGEWGLSSTFTHTYPDNGTYTVTVQVRVVNETGTVDSASASVTLDTSGDGGGGGGGSDDDRESSIAF